MKKKTKVLLIIALNMASVASAAKSESTFIYDPHLGQCIDSQGTFGRNTIAIDKIITSGNGECADLRGALIPGRSSLLNGFNLKGADLTNAKLSFAHINGSALDGAILLHMNLDGYSSIDGTTDQFTQMPILTDKLHCTETAVKEIYCM